MNLSPRQKEIAALVVQGKSNKAIAEKLGLSCRSIGVYLDRMSKRLGGDGSPRSKVFRWWYETEGATCQHSESC